MTITTPNARIVITKSDMGNYLVEIESKSGAFVDFEIDPITAEKLQDALK